MTSTILSAPRRSKTPRFLGGGIIAVLFVSLLRGAIAQSVWLASEANSPLRMAQVSAANLATPSASIEGDPSASPALSAEDYENTGAAQPGAEVANTARRFHYAFRFGIRGIYDDNINISHFDRVSDFITAIEPGLLLAVGDSEGHQDNYLQFNYAPSLYLYASESEADSFQQLVHLEGQYSMSRLTLKVSQDVQILDGNNLDTATNSGTVNDRVNLDVARRTRVNIFTTRLDASYYLAGKTFVSAGLSGSISDYSTLISSEAFSTNIFLNYIFDPKLTFGVGGGFGYTVRDDPNPSEPSEQASVRMSYQASGKLSFSASGGVEFRQFEGNNRGTYVSPVFEIGATYQPFDGTALTLSANRRTQNSAVLGGQDFSQTDITVTARQRLFGRFSLGVSAGYENSSYFSTVTNTQSDRTDNYFFFEPSIDMQVTRFWTVGAYYLHRNNDSSLAFFSFYDNQVGFRTSLSF